MKNNVVQLDRQNPDDLLTFDEVAKKYKIKYHTLYKYAVRQNEIPFYKKGGLKVRERDIINWLKQGLVPASRGIV